MALEQNNKIEFSDVSGPIVDETIVRRTGFFADGADGDTGGYGHFQGVIASGAGLYTRTNLSGSGNAIWMTSAYAADRSYTGYWKLMVSPQHTGTNPAFLFQYYNNSNVLTTAGTVNKTGFVNPSSRAIKTNITNIKLDIDNIFDKIEPVQFTYIKDSGNTLQYGFIYEDLVKIIPNVCAKWSPDPEMRGINYTQMIPILVQEIQNLRKRVASLEEALENK